MKNFTLQKCGEKHMETGEKRRKTEAFGQMVKIKSQGTIINKCARFRQQQHCECNCNCGRNKLFFTLLAQKQWPTANSQRPISLSFSFWLCSEEKKSGRQKPKSRRRISGQEFGFAASAANALCTGKKANRYPIVKYFALSLMRK